MKKVPGFFQKFMAEYPDCGAGYDALSRASREGAGYDEKAAEVIKLALAIGGRLEGAAHSHARRAVESGATPEEVRGVALLALTTLGFPHAMMGLSWINDVVRDAEKTAKKAEKKAKKAAKKATSPA